MLRLAIVDDDPKHRGQTPMWYTFRQLNVNKYTGFSRNYLSPSRFVSCFQSADVCILYFCMANRPEMIQA